MKVEVTNLTQRFGDKVIFSDISFTLQPGTVTVLMGKSGCGKSTLLRLLGGARSPNVEAATGEVKLDGAVCDTHHPDVVTVFQKYTNRPDLTVWENVAFPFSLSLWRSKFKQDAWTDLVVRRLVEVGLSDKAKAYPCQLSGGQNQRVALARAFVVQPKLLLLDEPFGALDPVIRYQMQELLKTMLLGRRTTVVLVTHDPEEAVRLGNRVMVLGDTGAGATVKLDAIVPTEAITKSQLKDKILEQL